MALPRCTPYGDSALCYLNGIEPEVVGKICDGLYLSQYQENFQIVDYSNVAYFLFGSEWYRLYFEGNTIFWRTDGPPMEAVNSDLNSVTALVNLNELESVVGRSVLSISYSSNEIEVSATISFSGGAYLKFIHDGEEDYTKICLC